MKSFIYTGTLHHRRTRPKAHDFSYKVALFYIDLSEVEKIFSVPFLFSWQAPRLSGFKREDYLRGAPSLMQAVKDLILTKTGKSFSGKVRMLTQIRYLGFCFNPVSFYYCFTEDEKLKFIISDITNTPWNERHAYVHEIESESANHEFNFKKDFHVSPFLPMDLDYVWRFNTPAPENKASSLQVHMEDWDRVNNERVFEANLRVQAKPFTARQAALTVLKFPLLTLKTVMAIYYQALVLKLKGAHFYTHPRTGEKL